MLYTRYMKFLKRYYIPISIILVLLAGSITIATLVAYLARLGVAIF